MFAMSATLKYALRYVPLLILALLLIPLHIYIAGNVQQNPAFPLNSASSPFGPGSALYGVTSLSRGDAWAVGGSFITRPNAQDATHPFLFPNGGIILHYIDKGWEAARVTHSLQSPLLSVSLDSPQDGWAVGWAGTFVHYDGNAWSVVTGPAHFNQNVLSVAMLSPSNGWAVGYSGSILHYDGKQWMQVQSPTQVDLRSVTMLSPREGWAVGASGTILHYQDGTWRLVTPAPTNNTLNSVSMLSSSEGWAVGIHGTILHYRDGTWESVYPANYYRNPSIYKSVTLYGIAMGSIRSGWIIGADQEVLIYSSEAWIEPGNSINLSGNGKAFKITPNNLSLYAIVLSPAGEAWAVGSMNFYNKIDNALAILHYRGGRWDVSPMNA